MNVLLDISFDGTDFCGFQVQKNGLSVCEVVQDALQTVLGTRPPVKGCSRTDSGVHALHYALNFWADTTIPMGQLPLALNRYLPASVRVNRACIVHEKFHARYDAVGKTYVYRILNSAIETPFGAAYHYRVFGQLDAKAMQKGAAAFVGEQDFASLCSAGCEIAQRGSTVRTISQCEVKQEGNLVTITVTADGYLYNMVRILAGTLITIGQQKMQPEDVPGILAAKNRSLAGFTAPAQGLFLKQVYYNEDTFTC